MTMYDIYRKAREDYIIVIDNMQELIINAHPNHVPYYTRQYRAYQKKLQWLNNKLSHTFH